MNATKYKRFVKVIASHPAPNQEGIDHLIGRHLEIIRFDPEEQGAVQVKCKEFGGQIILNLGEWERVAR